MEGPKDVPELDTALQLTAAEIYSEPPGKKLIYLPRTFAQVTLPQQQRLGTDVHSRTNGNIRLTITAGPYGLPYGMIARLILIFICTEAVMTKKSTISFGRSFAEFLRKIDVARTGGKQGYINSVREQLLRLLTANFIVEDIKAGKTVEGTIPENYDTWASSVPFKEKFEQPLTLSYDIYQLLSTSPIPLDARVVRVLRQSTLAFDCLVVFSRRLSYLQRTTLIPWGALADQFGGDWSRQRDFVRAFTKAMARIRVIKPYICYNITDKGLQLMRSEPFIRNSKLQYGQDEQNRTDYTPRCQEETEAEAVERLNYIIKQEGAGDVMRRNNRVFASKRSRSKR